MIDGRVLRLPALVDMMAVSVAVIETVFVCFAVWHPLGALPGLFAGALVNDWWVRRFFARREARQ